MQRPIKFRAKQLLIHEGMNNTTSDKWLYGSLLVEPDRTLICWVAKGILCMEDVDPKTVGQYTGLKDKNGKEICEGDLIKFGNSRKTFIPLESSDTIAPVVYSYGSFNVDGNGLGEVTDWHECEVIGNIHEHPDLLTIRKPIERNT